jgi:hypothetical protein
VQIGIVDIQAQLSVENRSRTVDLDAIAGRLAGVDDRRAACDAGEGGVSFIAGGRLAWPKSVAIENGVSFA